MAGARKRVVLLGAILALTCALSCQAASGSTARRMAMGDMPVSNMTNLAGTPLVSGNTTYILATKDLARKAYPWCSTQVTTSYFLKPNVTTVATTAKYTEYAFSMDENYGLCADVLKRKGKPADIPKRCKTPFYSFMIAVSTECHEAIMSVLTVQMFAKQDVAGANATEMYCHAHKGHDTGVPLLKYLIKPDHLTPSSAAGAKRSFVLTMRINKRSDNKCANINTLCGGNTCLVALSDEEYDVCPAFYSRTAGK